MPVRNENTAGATGWCLEVHDPAISKLVAGRARDVDFLRVLERMRMVDPAVLRERLDTLSLPGVELQRLREQLTTIS